jgi:hypothetical protein
MGASPSIFPNSVQSNSFHHHDMHRHVEPSTFTAPSPAALPSPSLKVQFLLTMTLALALIGLSISLVGPTSFSSGKTIEESDPAVVLDSLFHMRRTTPVLTTIPLLPLPETPQEEVIPPALAGRRQMAEVVHHRKRNYKNWRATVDDLILLL